MRVHTIRNVGAPADQAWSELAALDRIDEWLDGIAHSEADQLAVGARRSCRFDKPVFGREGIEETILAVEEHVSSTRSTAGWVRCGRCATGGAWSPGAAAARSRSTPRPNRAARPSS